MGPGLTQMLLRSTREDFVRTATEKLLTYALGRGIEHYDNPAVRAISRDAARDNYRISSWILAIVNSTPFQMRAASAEASASQAVPGDREVARHRSWRGQTESSIKMKIAHEQRRATAEVARYRSWGGACDKLNAE